MSHGGTPRLFLCHAYGFSLMLVSAYRFLSLGRRRFPLCPILYPTSYPYPIGRYSCLLPLWPLRLFVLVVPLLVYILGWRWDDPHLQSTLQPP